MNRCCIIRQTYDEFSGLNTLMERTRKMARMNKGFTLIELLVVIAIIALLLSIIMPALKKVKAAGQAVVCASDMGQVGKAMVLYSETYDSYVPRSETTDGTLIAAGDYQVWPVLFAPFIGGDSTSTKLENFWEIKVYNCPSYPTNIPEGIQTMDYVVNAWKYDQNNLAGLERHGPSKRSAIKNLGTLIYLGEYGYYQYNVTVSGTTKTRTLTSNKLGGVRVVTPQDLQNLKTNPGSAETLYLDKIRWMDVWHQDQLPSTNNEGGRRVEWNRHKKEGTNNLFFDGHVAWLRWDDNTPEKWRVRE
jgi:prepilin-type N-terminal cleavage/methylation domain-containing protein/prepilin-type processing-associated H-X9-DG protein